MVSEEAGKLWLSKFESSMVDELLCPKCRGELAKAGEDFYECNHCGRYFCVEWVDEKDLKQYKP